MWLDRWRLLSWDPMAAAGHIRTCLRGYAIHGHRLICPRVCCGQCALIAGCGLRSAVVMSGGHSQGLLARCAGGHGLGLDWLNLGSRSMVIAAIWIKQDGRARALAARALGRRSAVGLALYRHARDNADHASTSGLVSGSAKQAGIICGEALRT
jgi:hypothetical protein